MESIPNAVMLPGLRRAECVKEKYYPGSLGAVFEGLCSVKTGELQDIP